MSLGQRSFSPVFPVVRLSELSGRDNGCWWWKLFALGREGVKAYGNSGSGSKTGSDNHDLAIWMGGQKDKHKFSGRDVPAVLEIMYDA